MEKNLQAILDNTQAKLDSLSTKPEWEILKATVLGPKGSLTLLAKGISTLPKEEKPAFGQALNRAKKKLEEMFQYSFSKIEEKSDLLSLGDPIDPTLPSPSDFTGGTHPLTNTRRKIVSIFQKLDSQLLKQRKLKLNGFVSTR